MDLHDYFSNRKCPSAVQLVQHLIKYDPIDRISADDALQIEFLQMEESEAESEQVRLGFLVSSLK